MKEEDKDEFKKIGFNLDENPVISFIYRIQIVARRVGFFENFYKKFIKEDSIEQTVEPEIENVSFKGIDFVKMIFKFKDFKTEDVVKNIIAINDCVNFLGQLFGYTEDGQEIILAEFIPGQKIQIANRIEDGYFTIIGYDFDRTKKELKYKCTKGEMTLVVDQKFIIN
jgi:hypothetical protein